MKPSKEVVTISSKEEAERYIRIYYSYIIEDPKKRESAIKESLSAARDYLASFIFTSAVDFHRALDGILDHHRSKRVISLYEDLTGEGFSLDKVIPANQGILDEPELSKGLELAQFIEKSLPKVQFGSLVAVFGSLDTLVYFLDKSNLTLENILEDENILGKIQIISKLPPKSHALYYEYSKFQIRQRGYNPIQVLDSMSLPIIKMVISEVYNQSRLYMAYELTKMGFANLLSNNGGVGKIILKTHPHLLHTVPYVHKWCYGKDSIEVAMRAIEKVLYTISGYKQAEKTGNRDKQVRIINKFITKENNLYLYFCKKLKGISLMDNLIDTTGEFGFRKINSPKAVFEFYSKRKGLNWFDRTQDTYVQAWRIRESNGKWNRSEESAKLGIEAIEDVLYELPGYKQAEKTGNRDEQLRIINEMIIIKKKVYHYFITNGLGGLMASLIDITGEVGLRKKGSPGALFEFYSKRKGLSWFDQNQSSYITTYRKGRLSVVYKNAM